MRVDVYPTLKLSLVRLSAISLLLDMAGAGAQARTLNPVVDQVCYLAATQFFDGRPVSPEWRNGCNDAAASLPPDASAAQISAAANDMLARLKASHTAHYKPDQPSFYELLDILAPQLGSQLDAVFPDRKVVYLGIGLTTRLVDGRLFADGVYHGEPADRAGVLRGDEIISVDGEPYHPLRSFEGKEGLSLRLTIRRNAGGPTTDLVVRPQGIRPVQSFTSATRSSVKTVAEQGHDLGYIRLWALAGQEAWQAFLWELSRGRLAKTRGLVLDLRGGWGGQQADAEVFVGGAPTTVYTNKRGDPDITLFRWRKPIVVLVNEGTRSAKELLSFTLRKNGIALVGERTAGSVLNVRGSLLSDKSLLLLAVRDIHVDGERLEGRGVEPTVVVHDELPYSAGRDRQLTRALRMLAEQVKKDSRPNRGASRPPVRSPR